MDETVDEINEEAGEGQYCSSISENKPKKDISNSNIYHSCLTLLQTLIYLFCIFSIIVLHMYMGVERIFSILNY